MDSEKWETLFWKIYLPYLSQSKTNVCYWKKHHQWRPLCDESTIHYFTSFLRQAVVLVTYATLPPPYQPTSLCALRFPVVRREAGRSVCLCLHVCVCESRSVSFMIWWRCFGGEKTSQSTAKSGMLRYCDLMSLRQSGYGVRQCQGAFKITFNMERSLWISNDSYKKKEKSKLKSDFSAYPTMFSHNQPEGSDHNIICKFHSVISWIFHLAAELRLNFKVILINTSLKKQWLYNVWDTAAMKGRDTAQPLPLTTFTLDQICGSWWCSVSFMSFSHSNGTHRHFFNQ